MKPSRKQVLIRLDAGKGLGFGHLTRCMALAGELLEQGAAVTVATRTQDESALRRILGLGVDLLRLLPGVPDNERMVGPPWSLPRQRADAGDVLRQAPEGGWDVVVVDHYRLDSAWERAVADRGARVVVIDDLANRAHSADVIVDHNWYGAGNAARYDGLVDDHTLKLLGPRYAMLDARYAHARENRKPVRVPAREVVVSFGGTDVGGQTLNAVRALLEFPKVRVHVVLGTAAVGSVALRELAQDRRVELHVGLPSLADLFSVADLAVGAAGMATWERLCLGVPAIVATVNEEQSGVTRAFAREGVTRWLGTADQVGVDDYRRSLREALVGDIPQVLPVVDGHGAARVAMSVVPPESPQLTARAPRESDSASFVTALAAEKAGAQPWRARLELFNRYMQTPTKLRILDCRDIPVGVVENEGREGAQWIDPCLNAESVKEFT